MIAVVGEALIDLIVSADGQVHAVPGGGPYNAARTLARLGTATAFLGRLSGDAFGRLLHDRLVGDGVTIAAAEQSAAPTTLAVASIDDAGVASYGFYLAGTSAADLHYPAIKAALNRAAVTDGVTAVHVGTLGLVMEPIGSAVEQLLRTDVPPNTLVLLDPNCRPAAISDGPAYLNRIDRITSFADVVQASVEDLAYLRPRMSAGEAAADILQAGPRLVLVTDGPRPARAFLPGTVLAAEVPAVDVADTIGAGDAFGGGFLAWWTAHGLRRSDLTRPALVQPALRAAAAIAALTCASRGAQPPTRAEVSAAGWWPAAG